MLNFKRKYYGIKLFKISENLSQREKELDSLINSIIKKAFTLLEKIIMMLISIIFLLFNYYTTLLFNNRGHHRLSIAKILKLNSIPVKITVSKT